MSFELKTPFNIISFCGVAQAGKTSTAKLMKTHIDLYAAMWQQDIYTEIIPLAGPIARGLAEMGITKKKQPALYRKAAQVVGTEGVRSVDEDWWVKLCLSSIEQRLRQHKQVVIFVDDIRFPNERNAFEEMADTFEGSAVTKKLFYVHPDADRVDITQPMYQHKSEAMGMALYRQYQENQRASSIDGISVIRNTSSTAFLYTQVTDEVSKLIAEG